MATFEEVRDRLRPATKTVAIPTDSDLAEDYGVARVEAEQARARSAEKPDSDELRRAAEEASEREEEAREALEPHLIHFTFRAIGNQDFDDLIALHPATPEQRKKFRKANRGAEPRWDEETFEIALVAECCIDPVMTEEQVKELFASEVVNEAQRVVLFGTAVRVNQFAGVVDLPKGSQQTRR